MKQLFLLFSLVVLLAACNDSKPEQDLTIVPLKDTAPNGVINTSATSNQNLTQQMPANAVNGLTQTQTTMPQSVTAAIATAGMNPEHGKPGHSCDIGVGAPLNSAPTKIAAPATITQPTTVSQPAIVPAKTVTAKGMNPPHGEAGHRCDISVGAPLTSASTTSTKPSSTAATTITPVAESVQNSAIVPALQNTSISTSPKVTTAFTGKINPAHGQPGHDCKVAVGQPLP